MILYTAPHAAQRLIPAESETVDPTTPIGNQLFTLEEKEGKGSITMTGEELDSLAQQWLGFRAGK